MKKILIIGLCLLAVSGMAQKKQSGMFNYLFFDRMLGSGSDSLISPADTSGHFWFSNMENPVSELDGVNKRTLDALAGTKADTSTVMPTIRTAVTQATATTTDNSLLKTVGTSGREVEQTGVTIDDANIVSAPTFSATNLTDGYIPYHISDALGMGNSVIYNNAVNNRIGINYPSGGSVLHIADIGTGSSERAVMTLSNRNDLYTRRWEFIIGKGISPNYYELRIKQQTETFVGDLVLEPGRNTRIESNVGIGCTSPTSKLSVLGQSSTNLNLFNFVNGDINKLRTTFADATDSSSVHASSTSTGSPEFHIVGKGGATQFKSDSVSTTFLGTYAGIYVADASTAQSIPTGTTYTKSTAFTTNGSASNCTADAANDKITITKTGHYLVNCPVSFSGESPNVNWKMAAFLGGVEQPQVHVQRKTGTGGDVGSTTCTGIINVTSVPVDLDIRFRHDQAGNENITVVYSNLTVTYIGE